MTTSARFAIRHPSDAGAVSIRRSHARDWETVGEFLAREGAASRDAWYRHDTPFPDVEIPADDAPAGTFLAETEEVRSSSPFLVGLSAWRALGADGAAEAALILAAGWGARGVAVRLLDELVSDAAARGIVRLVIPVTARSGALRAAVRESGLAERRDGRGNVAVVQLAPA